MSGGANSRPTSRRRGALVGACAAGAIAVGALAPLPSQAGPKRQTTDNTFAVLLAQGAGTATKASLRVSFPLPTGISAAKGCKGKVVASAKVDGKKKAWSGKLAADAAGCAATIKAKLAGSALGKSVTVTFTFDGNTKLAPFTSKQKLLIATPAPVPPQPQAGSTPQPAPSTNPAQPTPADTTPAQTTPPPTTPTGPTIPVPEDHAPGKWASNESTPLGNVFTWTVTKSHEVPGGIQANNFKWTCTKGTTTTVTFAQFRFDDNTEFENGVVSGTYVYASGATAVTYHASITIHGDDTADGTITAAGKWDYGVDGVWDCLGSESFTGYRYGAVA